jgi:hypothetical protein
VSCPKERPLQRIEQPCGSRDAAPIRHPSPKRRSEDRCARLGAASVESSWCSRPAERRRSMPASVVSAMRSVGRSLVFPAALRGLRPSPVRGPRGRVRGVASVWRTTRHRRSFTLALSFEASARRRAPRGVTRTPKRRTPGPCLSWGSSRNRPSTGHIQRASTPDSEPLSRPVAVAPRSHGADGTTRPASRSDLVVSHHLAGLLRAKDRGLVASRCRSWGSPRCPRPAPSVPTSTPRGRRPGVEARQVSYPRRFDPSKSSPRSQPYGVTTA